jgi:hypothetical protein
MADTPATEQTLQELLVQAQKMNATLTKLTGVLGKTASSGTAGSGGGASAANTAMSGLASTVSKFLPMLGPAGRALSVLITAVEMVSKVFNGLAGFMSGLIDKVGKVAGILGEFAMTASSGNMKLSNMVDVMGDLAKEIPIIGGLLGALAGPIKYVIQRQEESLAMFRKMSSVGAGVGESLETLRANARSTGMSLDEYEKVVSKNGAVFATMGGDVQNGVKLFNKSMQEVMGKDSEVSRAFFGMGYTTDQAAEAVANYMRSQGSMNKQGLQDSKAVAAAALEAAQQTQYLAESTGKRREQIEEEIKKATEEENWQAYLAGLSEQGAKDATAKLKEALAHGGKDAGDMVKTGLMTGIVQPLTASQMKTDAMLGGAMTKYATSIVNASGTTDQQFGQMSRANADLAIGTRGAVEQFRTVNGLLLGQGKQGLIDAAVVANSTRAMENGRIKNAEQIVAEDAARMKKIKEAGGSDAANLAQQTQNLRQFGTVIDSILGTLSKTFLPLINMMIDGFQKVVLNLAEKIKPMMEQFSAWLTPWVAKFTKINSWEEFKTVMFAFWKDIKEKAGPLIKDVWESVKPVMFDAISKLFGFLWDALKTSVIPRWMRSDTDSEKEQDRLEKIAKLKKEMAREEEIVAKGGRAGGYAQRRLEDLKKKMEELNSSGGNSGAASNNAPSNSSAPNTDNAKVARDWAYSLMTGQAKPGDVPATIKAQVDSLQNDPDLKKQAEAYRADMARKELEAQQKREAEAAATRAAQTAPAQQNTPTPVPKPPTSTSQDSRADSATVLNNSIARLVQLQQETAENTKKTASLIASRGNLFRS